MAESGIYEIVNLVNGKRYVGSACDLKRRKTDHWKLLRGRRHHSRYLQASWNKHGEQAFCFRLLEQVAEKVRLIEREQHYIDTLTPEYNMHPNARSALGVKRSAETRAKVAAANRGRTYGVATRHKVGEASKRAWKNPEVRAKLLAARRIAWDDPERRRKGCEAARNLWADQTTREKLMASRRGTRNPATDWRIYNLIHTDGRIVSGIQFELKKITGISPAGMTQLLRGQQTTSKGWRLYEPRICGLGDQGARR